MIVDVRIPQLPESITEASLSRWKKKVGDSVSKNEILIELETDKTTLDIPSPQTGMVIEIKAADGATVKAGDIIARIHTVSPSQHISYDPRETTQGSFPSEGDILAMPSAEKIAREAGLDLATIEGTGREGRILKEDVLTALQNTASYEAISELERTKLSSSANELANTSIDSQDHSFSQLSEQSDTLLSSFTNSDISKEDNKQNEVISDNNINYEAPNEGETFLHNQKLLNNDMIEMNKNPVTGEIKKDLQETQQLSQEETSTSSLRETRLPMSRLRQAVAGRLILSQQTNAILTTFNEVNMQAVLDIRTKYQEDFNQRYGRKLGLLPFFIKAVIQALKKFPILNARIEGTDMVYNHYYDIGIAVSSAKGLLVPILRDADKLSFDELETQIAGFIQRAEQGNISVEELTGGTYTITNGGIFGSLQSTPIINPPQSAILGMHAIKERPIVENGVIVARPMMYLAQSYDHRLIDGREAVLSLTAIKEALEDPARLLLQI